MTIAVRPASAVVSACWTKASFSVAGDNDAIAFEGEHDGYSEKFGLLHRRRLRLDKEGRWLEGRDQIIAPAREKRPPQDVPFAVHFHLHPDNHCESNHSPEIVRIVLPDGATWEMTTADATVARQIRDSAKAILQARGMPAVDLSVAADGLDGWIPNPADWRAYEINSLERLPLVSKVALSITWRTWRSWSSR